MDTPLITTRISIKAADQFNYHFARIKPTGSGACKSDKSGSHSLSRDSCKQQRKSQRHGEKRIEAVHYSEFSNFSGHSPSPIQTGMKPDGCVA